MSSSDELTLDQLLKSREQRQARQRTLVGKFHCPVISLTIMAPGETKKTAESDYLAEVATNLVMSNFVVSHCDRYDEKTGYYALFVIQGTPLDIKRRAIILEDSHSLGRLFDIDVIDIYGAPISREHMGLPPRKCLLCDEVAANCVRSRAHPTEEVKKEINRRIAAFKSCQ